MKKLNSDVNFTTLELEFDSQDCECSRLMKFEIDYMKDGPIGSDKNNVELIVLKTQINLFFKNHQWKKQ